MHIVYTVEDCGFKADNLEDLKKQIEEFYSLNGYKPKVEITDNIIHVDIDTVSLDAAEKQFAKAMDLCSKSKFDTALQLLDDVLKTMPCFSEAYRLKAQIYLTDKHDAKQAQDFCIDALRWQPRNYWALVLMGNILANNLKDTKSALKYYERALELNPNDEIATTNVAGTYLRDGDYEKAATAFRALTDKKVDYPNPYYGLQMAYTRTNKHLEAFEIGVEGLKLTKDRPENPGVRTELLKGTISAAHKVAEGVNPYNVIASVKEALESKLTMPLEVREDPELRTDGLLQYGPAHRKNKHYIYFKSEKPNSLHIILHEFMHLEMNNDAAKVGENFIMKFGTAEFDAFCKRFKPFCDKVRKMMGGKAEDQLYQIFNMLGLCLMNTPLDLFVEQYVYERYSTLRALQFLNLCQQSQENVQSVMREDIQKMFPANFIRMVKICNMVTAMHIQKLYGIDTLPHYKATKVEMEQAKDLYDEFLAYKNCQPGDEYAFMEYLLSSLNADDFILMVNEKDLSMPQEKPSWMDGEPKSDARNEKFAQEHPDGENNDETMMMSMYMLGALQYFKGQTHEQIKKTALEIAMLGVGGINPNQTGYRVPSIDKEFGGYQLLAYYYVSWALAIPEMLDSLQLPFKEAYRLAKQMFEGGLQGD